MGREEEISNPEHRDRENRCFGSCEKLVAIFRTVFYNKGEQTIKIRRILVSFILVAMLICTMAMPASARTVSLGRNWSGFTYATSDTCNLMGFSCVIEADHDDYKVGTSVEVYTDSILQKTVVGSKQYYISSVSRSFDFFLSHIRCIHMLDYTIASIEFVQAS